MAPSGTQRPPSRHVAKPETSSGFPVYGHVSPPVLGASSLDGAPLSDFPPPGVGRLSAIGPPSKSPSPPRQPLCVTSEMSVAMHATTRSLVLVFGCELLIGGSIDRRRT